MAGYSGTPLARKLGIREECRVLAVGAPANYEDLIRERVKYIDGVDAKPDLVHLFTTSRRELERLLLQYRKRLSPDIAVWVSWPKKSSRVPTEVTENVIREVALPLGFVDVKVCAVDETWSGLKLVVRRELR